METYKAGQQEKTADDATASTLPAGAAENFERASEERDAWPEWKQAHTLTKHSGAVQIAHPATGPTMSSREIAELVDSRHDAVKRTIERLADRGVIELPPLVEIRTATKTGTEYRLGKRDSFVVVAQLSPEFTGRVVDRWQELEEQVAQAPQPAFKLPQSFAEALRLSADLQEANERLAKEKAFVEIQRDNNRAAADALASFEKTPQIH